MKFPIYALVALSALALSACGGGTTSSALPGTAGFNAAVPLASKVVVTARRVGGGPIPHLEITLRENSWPGGKLITKGTTGKVGKVTFSGNWGSNQTICVGGRLHITGGYSESRVCQQPFPQAVTLEFR
jgi:hypothetical protein